MRTILRTEKREYDDWGNLTFPAKYWRVCTSLQTAMCRDEDFQDVVDVPRLLLTEAEYEVSMEWYRGSKEGFIIWQ